MTPAPTSPPFDPRFASIPCKAIVTALAAFCLWHANADPEPPRQPDIQAEAVPAPGPAGTAPKKVDLGFGLGETMQLAEFPLDQDQLPGVMLPVHFNGKVYRFMLDTGCTTTVVDESLRTFLGQKTASRESESILGTTHAVDFYPAIDAKVGPLSLKDCGPVTVGDLRGLRENGEGADVPCDGILGMTFIGRFLWVFAWDDQKLCICESLAPAEVQNERRKVLKGNDIFMRFRISVDGDGFPAMLDTGFGVVLGVDKPRFDRLASAGLIRNVTPMDIDTSDGKRKCNAGVLKSFTLAQGDTANVLEKVSVTEAGSPRLGLPFLKAYYVLWDGPAQNALLYPRSEIRKAMQARSMPVLPWPPLAPQVRVEQVAPPAPAPAPPR
jgi:predicted aspartyl protease